jgi:hypothetical protein
VAQPHQLPVDPAVAPRGVLTGLVNMNVESEAVGGLVDRGAV